MSRQLVGSLVFESLNKLRLHVDDLARSTFATGLTSEQAGFLLALVRDRHPHPNVFANVTTISTVLTRWGNPVFEFQRAGASPLRLRVPRLWSNTPREAVSGALRAAVADQIAEARETAFAGASELVCPVTHYPVTRATANVDHEPPHTFARIVDAWLAMVAQGAAKRQHTATPPVEFVLGQLARLLIPHAVYDTSVFPPDAIGHEFSRFHRSKARLRVIHAFANQTVLPALQRLELETVDIEPEQPLELPRLADLLAAQDPDAVWHQDALDTLHDLEASYLLG